MSVLRITEAIWIYILSDLWQADGLKTGDGTGELSPCFWRRKRLWTPVTFDGATEACAQAEHGAVQVLKFIVSVTSQLFPLIPAQGA